MAAVVTPRRTPLSRQRVLEAALALVDTEGLDALSMRKLGAELGVEAMSVYKHVKGKDALLDGIVEQLWTEVGHAVPKTTDWTEQLRSFARAVRAMMHRHPQATPLLFSRCTLPLPLVETYARLLDGLRDAGFDEAAAARSARSLGAYAMGYGSAELYSFCAWRTEPSAEPAAMPSANTTEVLLWLGRALPPGTSPRLVQAAVSVLDCDPDGDFEASLDLALEGLRQLRRNAGPPR